MRNLVFFMAFTVFAGCNVKRINNLPSQSWEEVGYNSTSEIGPGLPAYDGIKINYKRNFQEILTVSLEKPVTVAIATKDEQWGYFQFPRIYRSIHNEIVAKWDMAADNIASYGKWNESYSISSTSGKTWGPEQKEPPLGEGLTTPKGDIIRIVIPQAKKLANLDLPDPVFTDKDKYGSHYYYRQSELPKDLQGIYLERMVKGEHSLRIEQEILNDSMAVRESDQGMISVDYWGDMHIAGDGSIITGIYPGYVLDKDGKADLSGISFYRSTDEGHTWDFQGRISYKPYQHADSSETQNPTIQFYEPAFEVLSDGSLLCVMRTGDVSPMYLSRSTDLGCTWSKPVPFTRNGVLPRLLRLENGVIVLASGRPGVQLRFCVDGKGEKWTDPFEMLPFEYENKKLYYEYSATCGYSGILSDGPDSFLLIYSDFKYKTNSGEMRKAIKVRRVVAIPKEQI